MSGRVRDALWSVRWYVSGQVATTVVEEYDDYGDAVVFPLASFALLSGLVYILVSFTPSTATELVFFVTMFLLAALLADRTIVSVWATKVYFTEGAAEPIFLEVSR